MAFKVSWSQYGGLGCVLRNTMKSLNKSNLNKTIGYILNFNRDTNNKVISIDIEVLQVDNNYYISIKEVIHHDLNKESKTLKRML